MIKKSILILLLTAYCSQAKVLIFTYAHNRPDFIEIQHKTFEKFLEDDYTFVVFSDAPNENMAQQIKNMCDKYSIEHTRIPQEIHDRPYLPRWPQEKYHAPAVRNVNAVMYSLNTRGFDHDDILVLLDSDMFLVKPINIRKNVEEHDMIGRQIGSTIKYIWHGILFLNMKTLPNINTLNFNCGRVNNFPVDAGGHSYYYLRDNPSVKVHYITPLYSLDFRCAACKKTKKYTCNHMRTELIKAGLDDNQAIYFEQSHNSQFFYNQHFLHYRSGTNWENRDNNYMQQKTNALNTYLNTIMQ